MKVIGITGNSGSGKSIACEYLKLYNCAIIDLDKIGHRIYENKNCFSEVLEKIGNNILTNNEIDRKKLSKLVFSDYNVLKELTSITDKYIYLETENLIRDIKIKNEVDFIILDGALILDSIILNLCEHVILVETDEEIRIKRIINRDKINFDDAFKRVKSQKNYVENSFINKHIIYNNKTKEIFLNDLQKLIETLK